MVRDMRGMRGKSRGLVDVCIGRRPKSVGTVHAGEAFAADGAHRHELLQDGIHTLAGYAMAASVGQCGVLGVAGGAGSSSGSSTKSSTGFWERICGTVRPAGRVCGGTGMPFWQANAGLGSRRRVGRVWDSHDS
jgi:hypothetical protein